MEQGGQYGRCLDRTEEIAALRFDIWWRVERQQRREMKPTASPGLWRPLRVAVFRNLLIADVISDAGAFMQNVGAAWLMVSLGAGPIYVALTQAAASLPNFLLALPAGAAMETAFLLDLPGAVWYQEFYLRECDSGLFEIIRRKTRRISTLRCTGNTCLIRSTGRPRTENQSPSCA